MANYFIIPNCQIFILYFLVSNALNCDKAEKHVNLFAPKKEGLESTSFNIDLHRMRRQTGTSEELGAGEDAEGTSEQDEESAEDPGTSEIDIKEGDYDLGRNDTEQISRDSWLDKDLDGGNSDSTGNYGFDTSTMTPGNSKDFDSEGDIVLEDKESTSTNNTSGLDVNRSSGNTKGGNEIASDENGSSINGNGGLDLGGTSNEASGGWAGMPEKGTTEPYDKGTPGKGTGVIKSGTGGSDSSLSGTRNTGGSTTIGTTAGVAGGIIGGIKAKSGKKKKGEAGTRSTKPKVNSGGKRLLKRKKWNSNWNLQTKNVKTPGGRKRRVKFINKMGRKQPRRANIPGAIRIAIPLNGNRWRTYSIRPSYGQYGFGILGLFKRFLFGNRFNVMRSGVINNNFNNARRNSVRKKNSSFFKNSTNQITKTTRSFGIKQLNLPGLNKNSGKVVGKPKNAKNNRKNTKKQN